MPSIQSTGGIFLRLDSSGNLTFYNTTGTVIAKFISGKFSGTLNSTRLQSSVGGTTTSTTLVSTGQGVSFTPQVSTSVKIDCSVVLSSSVAADGFSIDLFYTTAAIPADGSATVGTDILSGTLPQGTGTAQQTVTVSAIATGLTAGTAYNFYVAYAAVTGGTVTRGNTLMVVIET